MRSAKQALPMISALVFSGAAVVAGFPVGGSCQPSGPGTVISHVRIPAFDPGLNWFAHSVAAVGDIDGDGIIDLAVGERRADDGGIATGAVWIVFLNANGTAKATQKISNTEGGFQGGLLEWEEFGSAVAPIGDFDSDGIPDLAAGAWAASRGGFETGAIWLLFLNADGTVKSEQEISRTAGGFVPPSSGHFWFGASIAPLGDFNGDGTLDLAVGCCWSHGALWILTLNPSGTVKSQHLIDESSGGFNGVLTPNAQFGRSISALGDLDGDGVTDLAVGAIYDSDGGPERGSVWILFLNSDATVKSHQKISSTHGGFMGSLSNYENFGSGIAPLGDLNGDMIVDIAVGAMMDPDGGVARGAVWILFLNSDGTVKIHRKIGALAGGLNDPLGDYWEFGSSVAAIPDLNGDGVVDLVVGADRDSISGAVWLLLLRDNNTTPTRKMTWGGLKALQKNGLE